MQQLQRICNKFIRLVFNLKRRERVRTVMKENGLLTIKQMYQVELAIFMFRTVKKIIQVYCRTCFSQNQVVFQPEVKVTISPQRIGYCLPTIHQIFGTKDME